MDSGDMTAEEFESLVASHLRVIAQLMEEFGIGDELLSCCASGDHLYFFDEYWRHGDDGRAVNYYERIGDGE